MNRTWRTARRWLATAGIPAVAAACDGSPLTTAGGLVPEGHHASLASASLSVSPDPLVLAAVGNTGQLAATVTNGGSKAPKISWASTDPGVARVDGKGRVTARALGTALVVASAGGMADTAEVIVGTPTASLRISPETPVLTSLEDTLQLTVVGSEAGTQPAGSCDPTWTSDSPSVVTVNNLGLLTAKAVGVALVTASCGSAADTAAVTVTQLVEMVTLSAASVSVPVGGTQQLAATALDSRGNPVSGAAFSWASSSGAVASVDPTGQVTGVAAGTATVTASSGGKSASASVSVSAPAPAPVATVTVSPNPASVPTGSSMALTVVLRDASGNLLTGRSVTWSSSNTAVATVSAAGSVTGVAAGTATVTATSEGRSGTASLTVTQPPSSGSLNEPAGMTTFIRENGSRRDFGSAWWKGAKWLDDRWTQVVDDPTNPAGSGKAIEKRWYAGEPTDNGNGITTIDRFSQVGGFSARELYVRYRIKYSPNWDTRPHYDTPKLGYWGVAPSGGPHYWTKAPPNYPTYFYEQAGAAAPGSWGWGTGSKRVAVNTWHTVEIHITAQSGVNVPDGAVKMWLDGELQINKTGLNFVAAGDGFSSTLFDGFQVFFIRGQAGLTFGVNDWLRLGEFYVSGKR
jgi:uncharacterized protein YjdB